MEDKYSGPNHKSNPRQYNMKKKKTWWPKTYNKVVWEWRILLQNWRTLLVDKYNTLYRENIKF